MILYVKYPLTDIGFSILKVKQKFIVIDKIHKHGNWLVVYPSSKIEKVNGVEKVIYPSENKVGFYCKVLYEKDIMKFKGGFWIEKCTKDQWQAVGKKWHKESNIKLPRKLKKKICGKK